MPTATINNYTQKTVLEEWRRCEAKQLKVESVVSTFKGS